MQSRPASSPYTGLVVLTVIALTLPLFVQNAFYYDVITRICLIGTAAIGLNLLVSAGQVSLGHAAFYGGGAYASALLTTHLSLSPVLSLVLAAVAMAAAAWVVGRPIMHLRGHYLSMATLGLGIIAAMIINNEDQWTGGPDGMSVPAFSLFGHELSTFGHYEILGLTLAGTQLWYLLAAATLLLAVLFTLNLLDSPLGRALRALHGSETAAQVAGVDIAKFNLRVFVISSVYASVAGSLYGYYSGFITPDIASFDYSIELITMVVLGGMGSTFGAIIGAAILLLIPQFLTSLQELEVVLFGVILMLVMIFLPRGLLPTMLGWMRKGSR